MDIEGLYKKLERLNTKAVRLEAEVGELKAKMAEIKEAGIIKFKEFDAYKLELNMAAAQFLVKERLKIKRLLKKRHHIKDMSFLDGIVDELTFFDVDKGEEEENEKEMEQEEPLRYSLLTKFAGDMVPPHFISSITLVSNSASV